VRPRVKVNSLHETIWEVSSEINTPSMRVFEHVFANIEYSSGANPIRIKRLLEIDIIHKRQEVDQ